jgi:PAS domain S-box-containing protein
MVANGEDLDALRARAERLVSGTEARVDEILADRDRLKALAHELEVHQVELELQNEALRDAEQHLAVALDRYQALFEVAPVGYVILDEDGAILEGNITASTLLGVSLAALPGRNLASFVDPVDLYAFELFLRDVRRRATRRGATLRFVCGGEERTFRVEALSELSTDRAPRSCVALVDVSELEGLRRVAAEAEAKWRAVVEAAADAILTVDVRGRIMSANLATATLLGHRCDDLTGRSIASISASRSLMGHLDAPGTHLLEVLHRDGEVIPVELSVGTIQGEGHGAVTIILRDIRARRKAERRETELGRKLRAAMERVFEVQDEERRRIAGELHDEAGQTLSSLAIGLERLRTATDLDAAHEQAAVLQRRVEEVTANLSGLARRLYPRLLDSLGLGPAIEELVERVGADHDLDVDLRVLGVDGVIPHEVAAIVFRFVQEALSNAVRHAEARGVQIVVQRVGTSLRAVVEDDGRGFDSDAPIAGLGLAVMRERAARAGGWLDVEAAPGRGATLTLSVPLPGDDGGAP